MIAWMVYAALVGGVVAVVGWALERLSASAGWQRRFAWLAALTLAVAIPLAGRTRAPVSPAVQQATSAVASLVSGAPAAERGSLFPALPVPGGVKSDRIAALAWGAASLTGSRSRGWWGFAPAMGQPESLLERRLKTMSEKPGKLSVGRAVVLTCAAVGALVAACDAPVPTELRDAIAEAIDLQARESTDGAPSDRTQDPHLAKWFVSDPAPLVFADGVRMGRYEDLPESVRLWSESGLTEDGLVDRVEVIKGAQAQELYGEEGANGAIRIYTKDRPADEGTVEPAAEEPVEPDEDNLWGNKFSGMTESQPLPLIYIDGVRADNPADGNAMPWMDLKDIDIDRMEIFKGTEAARLYGDDAASGVILIFTRKNTDSGLRPGALDG